MESPEARQEKFSAVMQSLKGGRKVTDFQFDQVYGTSLRRLSKVHWTPVEVAIRAAELLTETPHSKILDVGSGCGKFCLIGATVTEGIFYGVEERKHLFEAAQKAKKELNANRANFIHSNMIEIDFSDYSGFYFFNPFFENIEKSIQIDQTVPHSADRYYDFIEQVNGKLMAAAPGSRIVTYHGYGGVFPSCFHAISREKIGTSFLDLWIRE